MTFTLNFANGNGFPSPGLAFFREFPYPSWCQYSMFLAVIEVLLAIPPSSNLNFLLCQSFLAPHFLLWACGVHPQTCNFPRSPIPATHIMAPLLDPWPVHNGMVPWYSFSDGCIVAGTTSTCLAPLSPSLWVRV